ncbi:intracellular ribonuclease lx [Phtheirospermum japonicum]|uniref:Intracellular ribonuclease lx n=1 Tax=Phtheirospermum japonicum TaxID=374723 RepID=A0A830BVQ6_9LAMI|nr:intracellular ribonuclease lx [Phtheirospermum japonicum]
MRLKGSILIKLFVLQCLSILACSKEFDFFYFVQQLPAAFCASRHGCCNPTTGKPGDDFGIHGLWPNYNAGGWPQNCDSQSHLNKTKISDLMARMQEDWPTLACPSADGMKFWGHEWGKHGTCSSLDQYNYFKAGLDLKNKSNLLQALKNAGIHPGNHYSLQSIKQAIEDSIGHEPYIECNLDHAGKHELFQVYLCVDKSASEFINCPILPHGRGCGSTIEFPSFSSDYSSESKAEL